MGQVHFFNMDFNHTCKAIAEQYLRRVTAPGGMPYYNPWGNACTEKKKAFSEEMEQFCDDIIDNRAEAPASLMKMFTIVIDNYMKAMSEHEHGITHEEKNLREALEEMRERKAATNTSVMKELVAKHFNEPLTEKEKAVLKQLATDSSMAAHARALGCTKEKLGETLTALKHKQK